MNNELILLIKEHTDNLIEQTKTKTIRNTRLRDCQAIANCFVESNN